MQPTSEELQTLRDLTLKNAAERASEERVAREALAKEHADLRAANLEIAARITAMEPRLEAAARELESLGNAVLEEMTRIEANHYRMRKIDERFGGAVTWQAPVRPDTIDRLWTTRFPHGSSPNSLRTLLTVALFGT